MATTKTMRERTQECFGLKPQRLAADAAYGSGLMIGWLMRRGIEPHIPLLDREHQTNGYFTRADFTFDPQANAFTCPAGKQLRSTGLVRDDGTVATFYIIQRLYYLGLFVVRICVVRIN